jgi:hypothetical protein
MKSNCEIIGGDCDFELIEIERLDPYELPLMITDKPYENYETYYRLVYDCKVCGHVLFKDVPSDVAEQEAKREGLEITDSQTTLKEQDPNEV